MWKRTNRVKAAQGNINSVIKNTTTKYGKEIESDNKKNEKYNGKHAL